MNKKLAIIVPYRDREEHIEKFIPAIENHLDGTGIEYQIWVVEQGNNMLFNKGLLMNAGYDLTSEAFDYFCFHDVDLLPETTECFYSYPDSVAHLSTFVQQYRYKPQYPLTFIGGVALFSKDAFEKTGGYSNGYLHWGAEDSDIYWRTQIKDVSVEQRPGKYLSLVHDKRHGYDKGSPNKSWATHNMARFGQIKRKQEKGEDVISGDGFRSVEYVVVGKRKWGQHMWVAIDFYDGELEEYEYGRGAPSFSFNMRKDAPPPFAGGTRTTNRTRPQAGSKKFSRNRLKIK